MATCRNSRRSNLTRSNGGSAKVFAMKVCGHIHNSLRKIMDGFLLTSLFSELCFRPQLLEILVNAWTKLQFESETRPTAGGVMQYADGLYTIGRYPPR